MHRRLSGIVNKANFKMAPFSGQVGDEGAKGEEAGVH